MSITGRQAVLALAVLCAVALVHFEEDPVHCNVCLHHAQGTVQTLDLVEEDRNRSFWLDGTTESGIQLAADVLCDLRAPPLPA